MANLLEKFLGMTDARRFVSNGKIYTSFTPHMHGDVNRYRNADSYCCDMESWMVFMHRHRMRYGREDYILNSLGQLLYNNRHFTSYEDLVTVFMEWVLQWRGNEMLGTREEVLEILESLREQVMTTVDLKEIILSHRIKSHWYPLEVELESSPVQRAVLKRKIRSEEYASMVREDIRAESDNFRNTWWNISPTVKHMSIYTDNSISTVRKYGQDLCVSKSEFTEGMIRALRQRYPGLSQTEFLEAVRDREGIDLGISTVKRYWSPTKALAQ